MLSLAASGESQALASPPMIQAISGEAQASAGAVVDCLIWRDLDADGVQDADEPGVPGAVAELFSAGPDGVFGGSDDCSIGTRVTDAAGECSFTSLAAGSYYLQLRTPPGYQYTIKDQGHDDSIDSDVDTRSGLTDVFTVGGAGEELSFAAGVTGEPQAFGWAGMIGMGDEDWRWWGSRVATDSEGNRYVAGNLAKTIDLGENWASFLPVRGSANGSPAVFKYDSSGALVWAKAMQGEGAFSDLAVDGSGNVYLAATAYETTDVDPGPGVVNIPANFPDIALYVVVLDSAGNYVRSSGGAHDTAARSSFTSIVVDSGGNVLVMGQIYGTIDFGGSVGTLTQQPSPLCGSFIAKYDLSGQPVWAKLWEAGYTRAKDMTIDSADNLYLTGQESSNYLSKLDPQGQQQWRTGPGGSCGMAVIPSSSGGTYWTGTAWPGIGFGKVDAYGNRVWSYRLPAITGEGHAICEDSAGNIYIGGTYTGTVDFDPGPGTATLSGGGGFVMKMTGSGLFCWVKAIGSDVTAISVDSLDRVTAAGEFEGTADLDPGPGESVFSADNTGGFMLTLDAQGSYLWAKPFRGYDGFGTTTGVDLDSDGNIYATGEMGGQQDFDMGPAGYKVCSNFRPDFETWDDAMFVCKYTPAGALLWVRYLPALLWQSQYPSPSGIAIDASSDICVTGRFTATMDFDPGPGVAALTSMGSGAFVLKLDSEGQFLWAKSVASESSSSPSASGAEVLAGEDGGFYVTGYFKGTVEFCDSVTLTSLGGGYDLFLIKLDSSGALSWVKTMESTVSIGWPQMAIDASGNVYIAGQFNGTADFDPGPGVASFTSNGGADGFIAKFDEDGNYLWADSWGGTGNEYGAGIAVSQAGEVWIAGPYGGTVDFDPSSQGRSFTAVGTSDDYIMKYDSVGNHAWVRVIAGIANGSDHSGGLVLDSQGNVYGTGGFWGDTVFDAEAADGTLVNRGWHDAAIYSYDSAGEFRWFKQLGADGSDLGSLMTADRQGNILLYMRSEGGDFDPGPAFYDVDAPQANRRSFLCMYRNYAGGDLPPMDVNLSKSDVLEKLPAGTVVGYLGTVDPDLADGFVYELVSGAGDGDNASFTLWRNALMTTGPLDFEQKNALSIRVRSTDSAGQSVEKAFTISVIDANDPPVIADQTLAVAEHNPGAAVGTVVASDPDAGQSLTYSIVAGNDGNLFVIDAATGAISLADGVELNFETSSSHLLSVCVTDNGSPALSAMASVTINVTDVNEAPTDIYLPNAAIAENQSVGAVVGLLSGSDPDVGQSKALTFTLVSDFADGVLFTIAQTTKQLKTAAVFDHEARDSYSVKIVATDGAGLTFEKVFTIAIGDVNERPIIAEQRFGPIPEGSPAGTYVGTATAADPDAGQSLTYEITGSEFVIDPISGRISLAPGAVLDYESLRNYLVMVGVTDSGTPSLWQTANVTILVGDVNDAPVNIVPGPQTMKEDSVLTFPFNIQVDDADAGESLEQVTLTASGGTVTLVNTLTLASISGNGTPLVTLTGTVTDINRALLGLTFRPGQDVYGPASVQITTTDQPAGTLGGPLTDTDSIAITILPMNDAPSFTKGADQVVDEDAAAQQVANWATAISAGPANEQGQTLAFVVTNYNRELFSVQPAISPDGTLTYTPAPNASGVAMVAVVLKDDGGGIYPNRDTSTQQTFRITINPVNDPPTANGQSVTVGDDAGADIILAATDIDSPLSQLQYTIVTQPAHGVLTAIGGGEFRYEVARGYSGSDSFTFTAADSGGLTSAPASVTIRGGIMRSFDVKGVLQYFGSNLCLTTVRIKGGTGSVFFGHSGSCDIGRIFLDNTTPKSSLRISLKSKTSTAYVLGGIDSSGPLGSIIAPNTVISGVIRIGGGGCPTIKIGRGHGMGLLSDSPIKLLSAGEWDSGPAQVRAPSLGKLIVRGDFRGDIDVDYFGGGKIGGSMMYSNITVAGNAGNLSIGGDLLDSRLDVGGSAGRLSVRGMACGSVVRSFGSIAGVTLGASDACDFYAGTGLLEGKTPSAGSDFVNPSATIKSFTIKGIKNRDRFFSSSNIAAPVLGKVSLLNGDFTNAGIYYPSFGSLKLVKHKDLTDSSAGWIYPPKPGVVFAGPDLIHVL